VSDAKEISSEYEKEVERRGEGEIKKKKVDKISFVCLVRTEFMLMKEREEKKKKFVKNNLVSVLRFLLCGEEKEREEEDSDGEDVENASVFQFLSSYDILRNDSLRSLLLSDERKILLNKTLLFSLRRDSPFTRRECLNVVWNLLSHGGEEEVQFVMREGGMKCVVLRMREKKRRKGRESEREWENSS
jgi:hypothetical protein